MRSLQIRNLQLESIDLAFQCVYGLFVRHVVFTVVGSSFKQSQSVGTAVEEDWRESGETVEQSGSIYTQHQR